MTRLVVAGVGAAIGFVVGGPVGAKIGWTVGSIAGGVLFQEDQNIPDGPKLNDLSIGSQTEGADKRHLWGHGRVDGRPIWSTDKTPHATEHESGGKGSGGGSYDTYHYTASFAVSFVVPHPSYGLLRRLWFNKRLVVDRTDSEVSQQEGLAFVWYNGQQSRADGTIEGHVGVGNVPSCHGECVLVVTEYNLTEHDGNRLPLIEAEIVTRGTDATIVSPINVGHAVENMGGQSWSQSTGLLWQTFTGGHTSNSYLIGIDPLTRSIAVNYDMGSGLGPTDVLAIGAFNALISQGSFGTGEWLAISYRGTNKKIDFFNASDMSWIATFVHTIFGLLAECENWVLALGTSTLYAYRKAAPLATWTYDVIFAPSGGYPLGSAAVRTGSDRFLVHLTGAAFCELEYSGSAWAWDAVVTNPTADIDDVFATGVLDGFGFAWWPAVGPIAVGDGPYLVQTDLSGNVVEQFDLNDMGMSGGWGASSGLPHIYFDASTRSIYFHFNGNTGIFRVDTHTLETRSDGAVGSGSYYHPETDTVWPGDNDDAGNAYLLPVQLHDVNPQKIDAAGIIEDLCEMAGVDIANDIDISQVPHMTRGFMHTRQTTARADLDALLSILLIESYHADHQQKFRALGNGNVTVIDYQDLAAHAEGSAKPAAIKETFPDHVNLPRKVELRYPSSDQDLQQAVAMAEHYSGAGTRTLSISTAVTLSDSEANVLAQQLLQLATSQQTDIEFSLPPRYLAHNATDRPRLTREDGSTVDVRITQIDRAANGLLQCRAKSWDTDALTAYAAAGGSGYIEPSVGSYSENVLQVLNLPLLRDADQDQPGPYLTAYTLLSGFGGALFRVSSDNQTYDSISGIAVEAAAFTCSTAPAAVDWQDWDDTNTLRVTVESEGQLIGATDTALLNDGANAAIWGQHGRWEIVQFGTATLISEGVYDLSHLLRGRRGTDHAIDTHGSGDLFILLSTDAFSRAILQNSDIGEVRHYKAPRSGQALVDVDPVVRVTEATALMPYSPIDFTAVYNTGDIDLNWTRRTRRGGSYGGANNVTDGVGGSLSEDSEDYEIDVFNPASPETVLRTLTVPNNTSTTYPALHIGNDGFGTGELIGFSIYQISAVAGRGYPATIQFQMP